MPKSDSLGAAAYSLVIATLLDLIETNRITMPADRIVDTASRMLDGLVEDGSLNTADRDGARSALESFRRQVAAAAQAL